MAETSGTTEETAARRDVTVLVAEDSPTQARRLKHLLVKNGFDVWMANDGREALAMLATKRPAIVLSDIVMPEMTGYEMCRAIRDDPVLGDIPVVLLTSLFEPSDVLKGLESGATSLLTKPYTERALLDRIDQTLANAELRRHASGEGGIDTYFLGGHHKVSYDPVQALDFLLGTFQDAIEKNHQLKETNARLHTAISTIASLESRYRILIENSVEVLLVVGRDRVIRYANHAAERLFKVAAEDFVGRRFDFPMEIDAVQEIELVGGDGEKVLAELRMAETTWDDEDMFLASIRDVTENVRLREELRALSLTDELTGLHNRRGFMTLAGHELRKARRREDTVVLIFADMDGLKFINDTFGHEAGDRAIEAVADVLRFVLRDSDLISRHGGDEFVILPLGTPPEHTETVIKRIQEGLDERNAARDEPYTLSLSMGYTMSGPGDTRSLDDLIAHADEEMYRVKVRRRAARDKAVSPG